MLNISEDLSIPDHEIELTAIRAQGSGGQHVNKVSSAIHLRFNITASSLPAAYKQRLLKLHDSRISRQGVLIIKAQQFRTQQQNRDDALERLRKLIIQSSIVPKVRRATKVRKSSEKKRLDNKTQKGKVKKLRSKVVDR